MAPTSLVSATAERGARLTAAQIRQQIITAVSNRGLDPHHPQIKEITHHLTQVIEGQAPGAVGTLEQLGLVLSHMNWDAMMREDSRFLSGRNEEERAQLAAARIRENVVAHHAAAVATERHAAAVKAVYDQSSRLAQRHNDAALRRPDGTPILPPGYGERHPIMVASAAGRTQQAKAAHDAALLTGDPAAIVETGTRLAAARANEFTVAADPAARILGGLNTLPTLTTEQQTRKAEALELVGATTAGHRATWDRAFESLARLSGDSDKRLVDCSPDRWASEYGHVDSIMRGVVAGRGGSALTPADYALAYDSLARTHGAEYAARHLILRAKQEGRSVDQLLGDISAAGITLDTTRILPEVHKLQEQMEGCGPEATPRSLQLIGPGATLLDRLRGQGVEGSGGPVVAGSGPIVIKPEVAAAAVVKAVVLAGNPDQLKQVVAATTSARQDTDSDAEERQEGHGLKVAEKAPEKGAVVPAKA